MGRPGVDFPILTSIPHTDFSCKKVKNPGYYADPETDCQVYNILRLKKSRYFLIFLFSINVWLVLCILHLNNGNYNYADDVVITFK